MSNKHWVIDECRKKHQLLFERRENIATVLRGNPEALVLPAAVTEAVEINVSMSACTSKSSKSI